MSIDSFERLSFEKIVQPEHPAHIGSPRNLFLLNLFHHAQLFKSLEAAAALGNPDIAQAVRRPWCCPHRAAFGGTRIQELWGHGVSTQISKESLGCQASVAG
jgi:hypothetical protein